MQLNPIRSMLTITALAVVLSHLAAGEPRDSGDIQVPRAFDCQKMTEAEAARLDGKRITVHFRATEFEINRRSGTVIFYCGLSDGQHCFVIYCDAENAPTKERAIKDVFFEGRFQFVPAGHNASGGYVLDDAKTIRP